VYPKVPQYLARPRDQVIRVDYLASGPDDQENPGLRENQSTSEYLTISRRPIVLDVAYLSCISEGPNNQPYPLSPGFNGRIHGYSVVLSTYSGSTVDLLEIELIRQTSTHLTQN